MITILLIRASSYVGTTWWNLVLGSHPEALSVGNPDKLLERLKSGEVICRICGDNCLFWTKFITTYDYDANLYEQIAKYSKKKLIIIVNPRTDKALKDLNSQNLCVKTVYLTRDARALAYSYMTRNIDIDIYSTIDKWLFRAVYQYPFKENDKNTLYCRHEDLCKNPISYLKHFSEFLGLEFSEEQLRYWRYTHHIVTGNANTIRPIILFLNRELENVERSPKDNEIISYCNRFEKEGYMPYVIDKWKKYLDREALFAIDFFCGENNAQKKYERDEFTPEEIQKFLSIIRKHILNGTIKNKDLTDFFHQKTSVSKNNLTFFEKIKTIFPLFKQTILFHKKK